MELDAALDGGAKVNAADFMAQHVARPLFPTSAQSKLSSADLLEQQKAADAEQLQKNLDEQKHHKLPSADPLEQLEAAQSEQVQKKPPLSADLEAALVELRTFLPVPEYMTQQKSKTLGIFGPKP